MAGETEKERLEKESFNYIRLGMLLKKARSQIKSESVGKVVTSPLSIEDKIREIEKIDGSGDAHVDKYRGSVKTPKAEGPAKVKDLFYKNPDTVKRSVIESIKNRHKIRKEPERCGFWDFIFTERTKILSFSRLNDLIRPGFLGLFPKINKPCVQDLASRLQKEIIPEAKPIVNKILETGWHQLRKYEYNLVAAFGRLLDEIAKVNFSLTDKNERNYAVRFFALESAFLFFHARVDYLNDLLKAIDTALSIDPATEDERKRLVLFVKTILLQGQTNPCLYDFIVTLSILHSRHFLRLTDIMTNDGSTLVSGDEFDCTPVVQREIDTQIESVVGKLQVLCASRDDFSSSSRFIPCNENAELDISVIEHLIGKDSPELEAKADVGKLAGMLIGQYMDTFGRNLEKAVNTFSMKTLRMIPTQVLEYELGKLDYANSMMTKSGTPLSYARFKIIKTGGTAPTQFEAEVVSKISEIGALFRSIGAKISDHIDRLQKAGTLARESAGKEKTLEPNLLDEVLADQGPEGQTIGERLGAAARTAYAIAGYFLNSEILSAIKSERHVLDEISAAMRMLESLALSSEYREVRKEFGLLGY